MFGIEHKIAETARKAGIMTASAALTIVGAAFLTTAAWIYLSAEHSSAFAAVVIGLIYLGAGVITLAYGLSRPPRPKSVAEDSLGELTPMQLVLVSFLKGLDQGKKARRP